jgi:hypothetical protein
LEETIRYSPECEDDPSGRVFKDLNECFTAQWKGKIITGEITDLEKKNYHQLYEELRENARNEFWKRRES